MIYCIWYPSGGFGHYINSVMSWHGCNFIRPKNKPSFGSNGNSHQMDLVLPTCFKNTWDYDSSLVDPNKNYSVLIDNGINDESKNFIKFFKDSKIIKICYSDQTWPIVAKTQIIKASHDTLENQLIVDENWPCRDAWAIREKYFLYLRDHTLRHAWRPTENCNFLNLRALLDYKEFVNELQALGIICDNFSELHTSMLEKNYQYFSGVLNAEKIIAALKNNQYLDISNITDLWDQAVINYFIQIEFGVEVPANTYANWFTDTKEMIQLL